MNRQKKSILNQTYRNFLRAGLRLEDEKILKGIVAENLMGFGTTMDEKIMNFAQLKEIIKQQKRQSKGMDFRWTVKPLSHYTSTDENTAVFADEVILKIISAGETIKMYMRFSIVLSYNNYQWKVIHWHGSKPENVQSEEDTFGLKNWKQKAIELEKLVDERTAELAEKNRELEIDAALERVRLRTMAMQNSNELAELVTTLFRELTHLDFAITSCIIWINNSELATNTLWVASYEMNQPSRPIHFTPFHHSFFRSINHAWKDMDPKWIYLLKGSEKKSFERKFFDEIRNLPKALKSALVVPKKVIFSASFNNFGALEIIGTEPLSDEKFNILHRFGKLFDASYTRFNDLKNAEAQAREAQIETSLERVRSRSLAMHHTSELQEVIHTVHKELLNLNIAIDGGSFIAINKDVDTQLRCWGSGGTADTLEEVVLPIYKKPFLTNLINGIKKSPGFFTEEFTQQEKKDFFTFLFKHEPWSKLTAKQKKETLSAPGGYTRSCYVSKHSSIFIINHLGKKFSEKDNDILKRFGKVFEQSYSRFLDLQNAEAQAREAEIQLALERVRAKTTAMQKTSGFVDVINVLGEQFIKLGFDLNWANFSANGNNVSNGIDIWNFVFIPGKYQAANRVFIPLFDHPVFQVAYEKFQKYIATGEDFYVLELDKKEKNKFFDHLFATPVFKDLPEELKMIQYNGSGYMTSSVFLKDTWLSIGNYNHKAFTDEQNSILKRLGNSFGQAYTRFLDLQKAEGQAREAQIEAALEKVRSHSLAMHKSDELKEVIKVVLDQFIHLNIKAEHAGFYIDYKARDDMHIWLADPNIEPFFVIIPYFDTPTWNSFLDAKAKGIPLHTDLLNFEEKNKFYQSLFKLFTIPDEAKQFYMQCKGLAVSTVLLDNVGLYIENFSAIPYTDEENKILMRFGKVFQQTYTRFLDLQKAEAQAREGQIQLALERVRARTMAMHNSKELGEVAVLLFEQVKNLGIETYTSGFNIWDKENVVSWMSNPTGDVNPPLAMNINASKEHLKTYNKWKNHEPFFENDIKGDDIKKHYRFLRTIPFYKESLDKSEAAGIATPPRIIHNIAFFAQGYLLFITLDSCPQFRDIFIRFAKVFEQTYTRFLDLQKAEAQALEAQIEAGLERVRSRAMAMQSSEEVNELIGTVFTELTKLDLLLTRCIIWVFEPATLAARWWMANIEEPSNPMNFYIKYHDHPAYLVFVEEWKRQNVKFVYDLKGQDKIKWDDILFNETELKNLPDVVKNGMRAPKRVLLSASFNNFGGINVASLEPLSEEHFNILLRFAKVFDLTYTRFLDLKNAEAQSREAQIEAALERVRSRTMAMQKSSELLPTAEIMFEQLKKLGAELQGVAFAICDENSTIVQKWTSIGNFSHPYNIEPGEQRMYEAWKNQSGMYEEVYEGEKQKKYYELFMEIPEFRQGLQKVIDMGFPIPTWQKNYAVPFKNGYVLFIITKPFNETQIFLRFGKVFEQTYTRFLDLQKAEAATKEAIKQASLDRIRADIASMRTTKDLERITPLIWNELSVLGIPFVRCGVFIMDEDEQLIHTFLSTPNGKAITAFHLSFTTPGNISLVLQGWRDKKQYTDHWDEQTFTEFAQSLEQQEALSSVDDYIKTLPAGGFYLHFLPFLQGMLYVGNSNQLSDENINLLQSVADTFATAYARYEDFNKLEAAKKQVDSTLNELRATQKQLIQSEKMASLGELTAGIAHEIQNPLNFVNNFSEVSTELIDEMKEELEKGDAAKVKLIADDLKQNLEKINHHGKRAEAIVKGMLQHSRTTTGKKEPTDINALCDEYLRLSYHGMRAKDKSFNATMKTEFDGSIGKINIIPQDIGRVLLNVFNNAFYACTERSRSAVTERSRSTVTERSRSTVTERNRGAENEGLRQVQPDIRYNPAVTVATKKMDDHVCITVRDNGNGIPKNIVDKIFQPFFTTKPTGQGTGLGLSLSYDIVKAHGGVIKVETLTTEEAAQAGKDGGSEFMIQLPAI